MIDTEKKIKFCGHSLREDFHAEMSFSNKRGGGGAVRDPSLNVV